MRFDFIHKEEVKNLKMTFTEAFYKGKIFSNIQDVS